jgi:hypothetical protein
MMRISFLALLLLALIGSPHFAEAADLESSKLRRLSRCHSGEMDFMLE